MIRLWPPLSALTCRLPAPARCMAWIVSSTLLRSLISTEHLASSGICIGKTCSHGKREREENKVRDKSKRRLYTGICYILLLISSSDTLKTEICFLSYVKILKLNFHYLCSVELPYLGLGQLVPDGQDSPHWCVDPGNMVYLQVQQGNSQISSSSHICFTIFPT